MLRGSPRSIRVAGLVASLGLLGLAMGQLARLTGFGPPTPPSPGLPANAGLLVLLLLGSYLVAGRARLLPQALLPRAYRVGAWATALALPLRGLGNLRDLGLLRLLLDHSASTAPLAADRLDLWLISPLCLLLGLAALIVALGPREDA